MNIATMKSSSQASDSENGASLTRDELLAEVERLNDRVLELEDHISIYLQLMDRDEYLASGLTAAGDSIVMTDLNGIIRYVNPAFSELTGYDATEVIGNKPKILRSGMHSVEFYRDMWETILSGKTWSNEVMNRNKAGEIYHAELTIAPVFDHGSKMIGFIAIHNDITRLKKNDAEMAQEIKELKQVLAAILPLGSFLSLCASCKKVKDENEHWQDFDDFVRRHSDIQISHGLCPGCARHLYPEAFDAEAQDE